MADCFEVVGYITEIGDVLCPLHGVDGTDYPLFGDSETDTPQHCQYWRREDSHTVMVCEALIDCPLTPDGYDYIAEAFTGPANDTTRGWARHFEGANMPAEWREAFFIGYLDCSVWSSTTDEGVPLDSTDAVMSDECFDEMRNDCESFISGCALEWLIGLDAGQCGHDFWSTRNHHGAGFWDRGLGEVGEQLTKWADCEGEADLYIGDDGMIYQA